MTHEEFQQKLSEISDTTLIEKAHLVLDSLCKTGAKSFTMTVPVRIDDTDIILSEIISRFEKTTLKSVIKK
jgi:hypothetical protein